MPESQPPVVLVSTLLALTGSFAAPPAQEDPFERTRLDDRVELLLLHRPEAARQSTFTFLPLGLALDDPGRAQFSHLVEHALVRATDPDSLVGDGVEVNGETTASWLRVETYAQPQQWREALARHAAWLAVDSIDEAVLAREKENIAAEERTTVRGGFTHKWAEAAWGQVVRHGRDHAAVHGDVANASAQSVREELLQRVKSAPVLIASVGPIAPAEFREEAERLFTGTAQPAPSNVTEAAHSSALATRSEASWDLDAHHYLEWIALPDRDAVDRVASQAASQLVSLALASTSGLPPGRALASVLVVPQGRYLLLSANLSGPEDVGAVREAFDAALAAAPTAGGTGLELALFQLKAMSSSGLDAGPIKRQLAAMGRDTTLAEAQLCLTAVATELALGLDRGEQLDAWRALDAERLEEFLADLGAAEDRGRLLLRPR